MSLVKVKEYLSKYGYEDKIMEFSESTATVYDASKEIGCDASMIAKTLAFIVKDEVILIVISGSSKIDNHKFKDTFHVKAKMIDRDMVEELVGHVPGGVCPFGVNDGVKVYLDKSIKEFEYVYPACGSCNSTIKLSIKELEELSNYISYVDVTNGLS